MYHYFVIYIVGWEKDVNIFNVMDLFYWEYSNLIFDSSSLETPKMIYDIIQLTSSLSQAVDHYEQKINSALISNSFKFAFFHTGSSVALFLFFI